MNRRQTEPDTCEFVDTPDRMWFPDCPDCGAPKGQPCLDPDGTPGCPHPARMEALVAQAEQIVSGRSEGKDG